MLMCWRGKLIYFSIFFAINTLCYEKIKINDANVEYFRNVLSYNISNVWQKKNTDFKQREVRNDKTQHSNEDSRVKSGSERNNRKKRANYSDLVLKLVATNLRLDLIKQDPFHVWFFRNRFRSYNDLGIKEDPSIQGLHVGDPNRLKNVILKAMQGLPIHVVVIGGSNSAGGGIEKDEKSLKGLYFNVFVDWWRKIFGDPNNPKTNIHLLALGGTGSAFFSFCFKTFLDDPSAFDIVLVETAVNFDRKSSTAAEAAEQLTRVVLSSPSTPAVMFINLVSGLGKDSITNKTINPSCSNLEDYGLVEIAKHYNITALSLRDIVCPKRREKRRIAIPNMASSDSRHIGIRAHGQVALMLIDYTIKIVKDVIHDLQNNRTTMWYPVVTIPDTLFIKKPTAVVSYPLCWTAVTPNRFKKGNHPSLELQVTENNGFVLQDSLPADTKTLRTDAAQNGWMAKNSSNLIRFRFDVPRWNSSSEIFSRSIIVVIRTSGYGGVGEICCDHDVKRRTKCITVNSKNIFGQNRLHTVATRVHPGKHSLIVKVVKNGMFMVSGILIGPPDFKNESL